MAQRKSTVSKKRQRLENLLERLECDSEVSLRDFKNAISREDFQNYEPMLKQRRTFAPTTGSGSAEYNRLFAKGMFFYNKGEGAQKNAKLSSKYHSQAEKYFEMALEQLEADVHLDPSIAMDYDRSLDRFNLSLSPVGMPRLRSSKSLDNQVSDSRLLDKRKVKIQVLKEAIVKAKSEEDKAASERKVAKANEVRSTRKRKKDAFELLEERLAQAENDANKKIGTQKISSRGLANIEVERNRKDQKDQKVVRKMVSEGGKKDKGQVSSGVARKSVRKSMDSSEDKLAELRKKLRKGHKRSK